MKSFPKPLHKDSPHFKEFWEKGNGKKLIDWSGAEVSFEGFEEQATNFYKIDDLGDAAVQEIFFKKNFAEAQQDITHYTKNGVHKDDDLPDAIKNLFLQTQDVPTWVDPELMEAGAELSRRAGIDSLISLRDYSLMGGYDYAHLNKPLIATGLLKKGALKRLSDTLEFWVHVTRKHGLSTSGKGYEYCIKTRLIHAYARLYILREQPNWDTENWGAPINQWDMMATYTGFSLVFLHSLKQLGHHISEKEELGIFHLWKYAGHLLGIDASLMANNKKEATEKFYLWTSVQPSADADSVLLAHALLNESLENPILKRSIQRKFLRYLHICCTHFLLDDATTARLQIPKVKFKNWFPKSRIFFNQKIRPLIPREKQISAGNKQQMQVLADYLKIKRDAKDQKHQVFK